jgi:cytochrome c553
MSLYTGLPLMRLRGLLIVLLAAQIVLAAADRLDAQQRVRPGRLSPEELEALKLGLAVHFSSQAGGAVDARLTRLAALHVPAGSPPTPFLPPGRFTAVFSGYLRLPLRDDFDWFVEGNGAVRIAVNDVVVLEAAGDDLGTTPPVLVEMAKGHNKLRIEYTSPAQGDATLRVGWKGVDFAAEALPPELLATTGDEPLLSAGLERRQGRQLAAERGCFRCHGLPDDLPAEQLAMPELKAAAPSLADAARRLHPRWVATWVLDPKSLRREAAMPKLLDPEAKTAVQQAADLAAFVATLGPAPAEPPAEAPKNLVRKGEAVFENLGCVGCHHFKPNDHADQHDRLSLAWVDQKFAGDGLERFLAAPHADHPWSRMPDFHLVAAEIEALAGYLRSEASATALPVEIGAQGDATRGAALFAELGCAQCHATASQAVPRPASVKPIEPAALEGGCLADPPPRRPGLPDFGFDQRQRAALRQFLAAGSRSLGQEVAAEFSQRQIESLRCTACHRRDGADSRLPFILEDEGIQGHPPELLPALTWTGEKLRPIWTERLLRGQIDHRARGWLRARMPAFPARAELIAAGLSHEHGFAADAEDRPTPDAALAAAGQRLIGEDEGFSCIKCHAVGSQPAVAAFEAPGINLAAAADRLRYGYYRRWMLDPLRVDPLTKMPKFSPDGRATSVAALDGDARRQFDAIWHAIQTLNVKGEDTAVEAGDAARQPNQPRAER